jgi:acetyl-CoA C-acetyltransferase
MLVGERKACYVPARYGSKTDADETSSEQIMTQCVVVPACRTAIGTSWKGTLTETSAYDLAHAVVEASLKRSGVSAADIDDVILGEGMYGGGVIARHAASPTAWTPSPASR